MNDKIQQLIDLVKGASPYIWHVAYKQAITDGILGVSCGLTLAVVALFWLRNGFLNSRADNNDGGTILYGLGTLLCAVGAMLFLCFSLEELINPGYAALQALTALIPR